MQSLTLLAGFVGLVSASPFFSSTGLGSIDLFNRADAISSGCSTTGTASCTNTTAQSNLCCFEAPGGLLLQTQFWDTSPVTGPTDSWTIHGLWPDHCDGTFDSSCDASRAYTGIGSLLTAQGASDTLSFMNTYWKDISGNDETFWEHEWSKHGTCMSTLKTACLPSGSVKGAEAVAFFQTVVKLFKTLPTYTWLASQGILPSTTATYTLSALTSALTTASGGIKPALDCSGTSLNGISWYYHLKGSVIDGTFVPISAPFAGSCGSSGIKYLPKTSGSGTSTTTGTSTATTANPTTTGLPSKGTIKALQSGSAVGGLLTAGTWSTQTLATFTFSGSPTSFTMTTSKGSCGVSSGVLSCGSGVTSTTFTAVTSGSTLLLASGGSTGFSSTGTPSGSTVFDVFTGSSKAQTYTLSIVSS